VKHFDEAVEQSEDLFLAILTLEILSLFLDKGPLEEASARKCHEKVHVKSYPCDDV
jgi:hypothetical protein